MAIFTKTGQNRMSLPFGTANFVQKPEQSYDYGFYDLHRMNGRTYGRMHKRGITGPNRSAGDQKPTNTY